MANIVETERKNWIDQIRAFATIGVIFLHVSAPLIYKFGSIPMQWWWSANIYNTIVRNSVPLFFMISGALLLTKEIEIPVFLKKRLLRVVYPFLFWASIHIIVNLTSLFQINKDQSLQQVLYAIFINLKSGISFHYWYVYVVIGIYFALPILGKWIRNSSKKEIQYFLMIWLICLLLSQTAVANFRYFNQMTTFFNSSIGYLILGYYLVVFPIKKSDSRFLATLLMLIFVSLLITCVGTYYLSVKAGKTDLLLYSNYTIFNLTISVCLFILFMNYSIRNKFTVLVFSWISKYSYGIYLSHILVLSFLSFIHIDGMLIHPVLGILITCLLCISISGSIVYVINKIPFGKYISG